MNRRQSTSTFYFSLNCILILLATCSTIEAWNKANLDTLKFVQIIMRHGDRNPIWTFPLDPHKNDSSYWPGGFEQLTDLGVKQTHELGRYIRERYDGFVSKSYLKEEVSAWSSFTDRSIRSGTSFLRGLYPKVNKNDQMTTISSKLDYDDGEESQVVPLRTITKESDNYIYYGAKCPRWSKLEKHYVINSPKGRQLQQESIEIVKTLKNHTGLHGTLDDVGIMFDYINCQNLQNKTLPPWVKPEIIEFGDTFISYRLGAESQTKDMKKLRSGIVQKTVQNLETKIRKATKLKFVLYSGHDRTIITFLNILNLYNELKTPYAAAILVELHKSPKFNDHIVEIYFRNETTVEPYLMEMSECPRPCQLSKFLNFTKPFFIEDFQKACMISDAQALHVPLTLMPLLATLLARFW
ncbi:unnamed protein product [Allacma fusca]|uniref:acid phosphatase n=1 Tax=Allacma fusca TaxID=39272 RepID=A0A8J2PLV4_9HEXA|nr:unnamed protein product [Allacma fusca]